MRSGYSELNACVHAQLFQSYPTLCDPMDCSPPGSSVHRILQARILEWLPCPPPGDLPDSGIEHASPMSPALQAVSLPTEPPREPGGLNGGPQKI